MGYTGGHAPDPNYRMVCGGSTGHAEAVEVLFDPGKITYEQLLDKFFQKYRYAGAGARAQYRGAIFYHDSEQERLARKVKKRYEKKYGRAIITQINPASTFYKAEDYHQDYYRKKGGILNR